MAHNGGDVTRVSEPRAGPGQRRRGFAWTLALAVVWASQSPAEGPARVRPNGQDPTPSPPPSAELPLQPIYRCPTEGARQRLLTADQLAAGQPAARLREIAFRAVVTNVWLPGLVPVFGIERPNDFELRRRPPPDQEPFLEPLFFALPPEDDLESTRLAGYWECRAIRGDGSRAWLGWELAVEGEEVAGRFDQNTEYRFGLITGGTFREGRLVLHAAYNADRYLLNGVCEEGRLRGHWRHVADTERGTWEASRAAADLRLPPAAEAVPLYEWRRRPDGARRYAFADEPMEPAWERTARPLCRVWRPRAVDSAQRPLVTP